VRLSTEIGGSDRLVLRCPACGERTILLGRGDDWYREGSGRSYRCACGSGVRLAHRVGEECWTCRGCPPGGLRRTPSCPILTPLWAWGPPSRTSPCWSAEIIGTLAGQRLPEGMRNTAMQAIGMVTLLIIGVQNFLVFGRAPTQIVPTLTSVKVR